MKRNDLFVETVCTYPVVRDRDVFLNFEIFNKGTIVENPNGVQSKMELRAEDL